MTALIILASIFTAYIIGPKIICLVRGHRYDQSQVLWRSCKCCGKTQYLHVYTNTYID